MIFARTRVGTGQLANELSVRGFPAEALNGDMSQDARLQILKRFRNKQLKVLVATDVAARGLDIDDISHVFNYDLPQDPEIYVHRIGRTGRAGKKGVAISLLTPKENWRLGKIEAYSRQKIEEGTLPTIEEIQAQREAHLLEQMMTWLRRGRCRREREIVEALAEEGHDIVEIAAAALKLARAEEKQRPIPEISPLRSEPKKSAKRSRRGRDRRSGRAERGGRRSSHEVGMVRLILNQGRANGLKVNHVVSALAHYSDIPGKSIGRIRIEDQETWVDVPEEFVAQVLEKTGRYRINKQLIQVERA